MNSNWLWLILALGTGAQGASPVAPAPNPAILAPVQQEAQAARLAAEVLARFHYKPVPLDEALSARIFDQYLKLLDSEKLLFVQEDIDRLSVHRTRLGEGILKQDLGVPFTPLIRIDVPTYAADDLPPELAAIPAIKPGSRAA